MDRNATTRGKETCHLDVLRIHQSNQVFHNNVYTIFMKSTMATKTKQIEFQTLALNHLDVRYIADTDLGKVGLACDRT